MTSKRDPDPGSELERANDGESPSTLRSIEAAEAVVLETEAAPATAALPATAPDAESPGLPLYYEPQPLVAATDHKTIELQTVKLAQDIDPRKLPTELRLARPNLVPPDSGWPQAEVVVVSSQPPLAARRRWRAPVVLLVLLGALVLLVLALGAARRRAAAQAASAAQPLDIGASASPLVAALPSSAPPVASETAPSASEPEPVVAEPAPQAPGVPSAPPFEKRVSPRHGNAKLGSRSPEPAPNATSPALSAPGASKPKRAIY